MEGADVGDLQAALKLFLDQGLMLQGDEDARQELSSGLTAAQAAQKYEEATWKLVRRFQEEHGIEASGTMDESTANAMNRLLGELGELVELAACRSSHQFRKMRALRSRTGKIARGDGGAEQREECEPGRRDCRRPLHTEDNYDE